MCDWFLFFHFSSLIALSYLRTIRHRHHKPVSNPPQISLEWLDADDMSDEQLFELAKFSFQQESGAQSSAVRSVPGAPQLMEPLVDKQSILAFASQFRAVASSSMSALLSPLSPTTAALRKAGPGRWSDARLIGTESASVETMHANDVPPVYQRWRLDMTECGQARLRKRLERPSFLPANVIEWVQSCQKPDNALANIPPSATSAVAMGTANAALSAESAAAPISLLDSLQV